MYIMMYADDTVLFCSQKRIGDIQDSLAKDIDATLIG